MGILDSRSMLQKFKAEFGANRNKHSDAVSDYLAELDLQRIIQPLCETELDRAKLAMQVGISASRLDELAFSKLYLLSGRQIEVALDTYQKKGLKCSLEYINKVELEAVQQESTHFPQRIPLERIAEMHPEAYGLGLTTEYLDELCELGMIPFENDPLWGRCIHIDSLQYLVSISRDAG